MPRARIKHGLANWATSTHTTNKLIMNKQNPTKSLARSCCWFITDICVSACLLAGLQKEVVEQETVATLIIFDFNFSQIQSDE